MNFIVDGCPRLRGDRRAPGDEKHVPPYYALRL